MRLTGKITVLSLILCMLVLMHSPAMAAVRKPAKPEPALTIIKTAEKYLKTPYRFGGDTPKGFDCSGFVKYVYGQHGRSLPRAADVQYRTGKKIEQARLKAGDLVFFTTYAPGASHVGIYTGNGRFIHASSSRGVMVSRLDEAYWQPRYLGARRIIN